MAGRPRDRINAEWGRLVQGDASQDVWQLHDFLHGQAARMERQKQRPEWETTLRLLAATAVEAEHLHAVALLFDEWGVRCDRLMASNALSASQFLPHGRPKGLLNLALATESEDLAVLVAEHVEGVAKDFCLKQAAALGFTEVMEMLISQHGADAAVLLHAPEGQHAPICHAVMTGDCAMATLLLNLHRDRQLDGGSVLERPCSHAPERLLLFHAIKAGADVPIVACLIELGADPRRVMDRPPLQAHQLAAAFGRPAIMEYLIFAVGLDPHIIYKPRRRLLHLVCGASDFGPGDDTTGALPVVQFLVERCGLSMTVVASGRTPHERAARTGLIATCAYLKRRLGLPTKEEEALLQEEAAAVAARGDSDDTVMEEGEAAAAPGGLGGEQSEEEEGTVGEVATGMEGLSFEGANWEALEDARGAVGGYEGDDVSEEKWDQEEWLLEDTPDMLICPISTELLTDPLVASDGFTYSYPVDPLQI